MAANFYALGAIALWASLATLAVQLSDVPPFLLTGLALVIGSVPALPYIRQWRMPAVALLLGVGGIFGYHFLLFLALRHAPPVQANLVNYLWPLFVVVLAPLILPDVQLRALHVVAAILGFSGATLAIVGGKKLHGGLAWGYLPALAAAVTWAGFSLGTRRLADQGKGFRTPAIGLLALVSGILALVCHALLEPHVHLTNPQWLRIAILGAGPLGAAFYLWDRALKLGNAPTIGVLSYVTPLASTALLLWTTRQAATPSLMWATFLIVGSALLVLRVRS